MGLSPPFVAGTSQHAALKEAARMSRQGFIPMLNFLGEHVKDPHHAHVIAEEYETLARGLAQLPEARIAIKPSQLGALISEDTLYLYFDRVAESCAHYDVGLEIDIESAALAGFTPILAQRAAEKFGVLTRAAISTRVNSPETVSQLIYEGIPVRLVKGAYENEKELELNDHAALRERFQNFAERLIAEHGDVAFATHDLSLLSFVKDKTEQHGVKLNVQFLYNFRTRNAQKLLREGQHITYYLPYGPNFVPYVMRRWKLFAERPHDFISALFG